MLGAMTWHTGSSAPRRASAGQGPAAAARYSQGQRLGGRAASPVPSPSGAVGLRALGRGDWPGKLRTETRKGRGHRARRGRGHGRKGRGHGPGGGGDMTGRGGDTGQEEGSGTFHRLGSRVDAHSRPTRIQKRRWPVQSGRRSRVDGDPSRVPSCCVPI